MERTQLLIWIIGSIITWSSGFPENSIYSVCIASCSDWFSAKTSFLNLTIRILVLPQIWWYISFFNIFGGFCEKNAFRFFFRFFFPENFFSWNFGLDFFFLADFTIFCRFSGFLQKTTFQKKNRIFFSQKMHKNLEKKKNVIRFGLSLVFRQLCELAEKKL